MFNRTSDADGDMSYGFVDPLWPKYDFNTPTGDVPVNGSHGTTVDGHSFGSSMAMDWAPSASTVEQRFAPQDNVELDDMNSSHHGGGVGRLVAHFENKSFAPPLPPRPSNTIASPISPNLPVSSPFGSFSVVGHDAPNPLGSPSESNFGHMNDPSQITSPILSPPPMSFEGFHDMSRVTSPIAGPSSGPFSGMDDFMANNGMNNSMMASPTAAAQGVPGTPGFSIWRPPALTTTSKPVLNQSHVNSTAQTAGPFLKPPIPSTPKPVMNAGGQFVLDFNNTTKAKGKAPMRPPVAKQIKREPSQSPFSAPSPQLKQIKREPSYHQFSTPMSQTFSPEPIQSPQTPHVPPTPPLPTSIPNERRGSVSLRSQTGTRPSREQVPAEAWESFKTTIRTLYLEERKPLKEVMSIMSDKYGFQATPKMYKTRFSQWGFVKNNTEDEVKRLLSMKFQRDAEGKVSEFVRNGKVVNLGTYLKRKGVTEYDLVDFETPADLPSHIRCRTPTPPPAPGYLQSPDLIRAHETVVGNMRKAFLQCRQFEVETNAQVGWSSMMVWGAGSSDLLLEANFYFEARDADQGGHFLMRAFKQLESDLKKLSPQGIQELLLGMVHRDPGMVTALCKYLAAYSSTNFERSHPLRQIFTCLYEVQQKHGSATLSDLLWGSIPPIAEELEAIYGRRHPYVARTWIDLAMFHNYVNPERLDKMITELQLLQRQMEHRQGPNGVDVLILRYGIIQLMAAISPNSEGTKQTAVDLWNHIRKMGIVFPVRDSRPNVFCYHSPVKVDPWTKRCRRRYDAATQYLEQYCGIRLIPYFEEDFHTTEHVPESAPTPQDSWAAAMQQHMSQSKWGFL